jgi:AraC-like DNA-binding protein
MSAVFRALDVPAADREEYWRDVIARQWAPIDHRLDDPPGADDELVVGRLGAVHVAELGTGPGRVRRTDRHVRQVEGPDRCLVITQVRGIELVGHDDVLTELRPGDFSLLDLGRPYRCVHPVPRRSVLLSFPRRLLPLSRAELARSAGVGIRADSGTPALVSTLLRRLPGLLDDDRGALRARLGTAVLDLLAVALAARLDEPAAVPAEGRRRALLVRIHAYIEARLPDPGLTPAGVAGAHHISVRYLHRLFESEADSVAALIRRRRLERCRSDLLDPGLATRPVAAIATRWGFGDTAHFNRLFREAYGMPPGEFRRVHAPAVPG